MADKSKFEDVASLLPKDLKKTPARLAVLKLLNESDSPLQATDLHTQIVKSGEQVNLATVYRILDAFVEHGIVSKVYYSDDVTAYYELKKDENEGMNSVVCLSCKKRFFLKGLVIDEGSLEKQMDGFHVTAHKMELFGYCKDCSERFKNHANA